MRIRPVRRGEIFRQGCVRPRLRTEKRLHDAYYRRGSDRTEALGRGYEKDRLVSEGKKGACHHNWRVHAVQRNRRRV